MLSQLWQGSNPCRNLTLAFFFVVVTSCSDTERKASISNDQFLNREIIGKIITFPKWLQPINNKEFQIRNQQPIILTTVNTDCNACIEKFLSWTEYENLDKLKDYQIIFVALGPRSVLIDDYLKTYDKQKFTILLDTSETFVRENNLFDYHQKTVVLDKKHKIRYVGDPVDNEIVLKDLIFLHEGL